MLQFSPSPTTLPSSLPKIGVSDPLWPITSKITGAGWPSEGGQLQGGLLPVECNYSVGRSQTITD